MRDDCIHQGTLSRRRFVELAGAASAVLAGRAAGVAQNDGYPDLQSQQREHHEMGIVSPGRTYRAMEWEFHTPAQQTFDIDLPAAVAASRDAGAESLMFYTQDHWGYAFYPSTSAVRHPNLKFDLFGTECGLAREAGISVMAYYSLQFNNQCAIAHPDWAWTNEKGEEQRFYGRWHVMCLDSPYRQYVLGMMEEIFSRYDVDELFLDIFGIQFEMYNRNGINPFCFCRHTQQAWEAEFPGDPYRAGFDTRDGWQRRFTWHQKRTMTQMLDEVIATARKHRPSLLVSLNGGPEAFPDDIMQRVSFIYAEPLDCPTGIALGSILMRGWGRPYYQAGIFTAYGYSDAYPGDLARVQADALLVQNARTFFVGNAGVVSGVEGRGFSNRWFAVAKQAWADARSVDCLLGPHLKPLLSSAVLYSNLSRREAEADKRPSDFRHSVLGALETMTFSGRPVESVPDHKLSSERLGAYELLVLPEVSTLTSQQAEILRRWVADGGTLIASGACGLLDENHRERDNFVLADVLGVNYVSTDTRYSNDENGKPREGNAATTYLESVGHPLTELISEGTVGLPGPMIHLKETTGEAILRYRLPLLAENAAQNRWVGWGAPPPGPELAGTAAVLNRFHKGTTLYLGVPVFRAMQGRPFWIQEWIPDVIRKLVPLPLIELRTDPSSEYVHSSFFQDEARGFVIVQILDTVQLATSGEMRPTPSVAISIDSSRMQIGGARTLWPQATELKVVSRDGRTRIELPHPQRYTVLCLKQK